MVEEYREEMEDLEEDQMEDQMDKQADLSADQYEDVASYKPKDDLYSLFKWVIKKGDSSKVGNLNKQELGMFDISVRDCQKIMLLGHLLEHNGFGEFFGAQGEITLATSGSKDGWLPELFVTARKYQTKTRKREGGITEKPKKKFSFFGRKRSNESAI